MSTIRNPNGSSSEIGPDWQTFAWAVFIFHYAGFDYSYQQLLTNESNFFHILRTQPNKANTSDIQEKLIKGFLNAWKCRMLNKRKSAKAIRKALHELLPYFGSVKRLRIETVNFDRKISLNNTWLTVSQVIEQIYKRVSEIGFRLGPTGTSKLLHVLQPKLFVMWDKKIRKNYKNHENSRISENAKLYRVYLEAMHKCAKRLRENFKKAKLEHPAIHGQNPAEYLSRQMNIKPAKTLAKYLDECNWVTITKNVELPPKWYPKNN